MFQIRKVECKLTLLVSRYSCFTKHRHINDNIQHNAKKSRQKELSTYVHETVSNSLLNSKDIVCAIFMNGFSNSCFIPIPKEFSIKQTHIGSHDFHEDVSENNSIPMCTQNFIRHFLSTDGTFRCKILGTSSPQIWNFSEDM